MKKTNLKYVALVVVCLIAVTYMASATTVITDLQGTFDNIITGNLTVSDNLTANSGRATTFVVATNNSSTLSKQQADWVCDGVGDNDDVEIQAAIDALPNTGGRVLLMEGTYNAHSINLHGSLNNKNNVEFVGMGWSTIIKLPSMTRKNVLEVDGIEGLLIANLQIDGNYANQDMDNLSMRERATNGCTASVCEIYMNNVYVKNAKRVTVENVYSHSSVHPAILFHTGTEKSMVKGCYVKDVQWNGIEFWHGGKLSSIVGCYSENNYKSGIVVELNGEAKVSVIGNVVSDDGTNSDTGITTVTNSYVTIVGNTLYKQKIAVSGSDHVIVQGNIVYVDNRDTQGIWVIGDYNQIIGNNIYYSYYDPIRIEGDYNIVSDNTIHTSGASRKGINIIASASYNKVTGNIISGIGTGINEELGCDFNEVFDNSIINCTTKISLTGSNSVARRNLGYTTKNGGSELVVNASTIAHGLVCTPSKMTLTTSNATHIVSVISVNGTNITIGLKDNAGTDIAVAETVYWYAECT